MANISGIDLNLLVVLNAIHTEGSITKAGETLYLTQPALSHALSRLRDLLDDPLFVRSGHKMVPTPLTNEIIPPVRRALAEIEGTLKQRHKFNPGESLREFRIGLRHVVETTTIPDLAGRVADSAPHIRLTSMHYDRDSLYSELASGNLDVAIDVLLPRAEGVKHKLLMGGKMVVVARQGHPQVQDGLDLDTYMAQSHVLATSRRSGPGVEDMALHRLGLERRIRLRCQHFSTACETVARTDLLLTMYGRYAQALNAPLANRIFPLPYEMPLHELYLYWHASADQQPANRWLREQIAAIYHLA